jgi:hypothetical protein
VKGAKEETNIAKTKDRHFVALEQDPPLSVLMMLRLPLAILLSTLSAAAVDFKKDIAPILEKNCYECHSEQAKKKKAGYVFDDLETLKLDINPKGAIVPGNPAESHFFIVVADPNHEAHMPPDGNLSSAEIEKLRTWITEGAALDASGGRMTPVNNAGKAKPGLPPIMTWVNFEGKKIKAGFVRLEGDNVILRMPATGQEVPYPMGKLDAASQQQAKDSAQ